MSLDTPSNLPTRSFLILYASITGTSLDLSERISRKARLLNWRVQVKNLSQFCQADLLSIPLILFVLPTTGNGTAPPELTTLWNALLHPDLPSDLLEDLSFAVFALGDSSYPKFNWTGRKMFNRLTRLGAKPVVERGEGDDQNEWGIESTFPKWLNLFLEAIDKLAPLPPSTSSLKLPISSLSLATDTTTTIIPTSPSSTTTTNLIPPPPRIRLDLLPPSSTLTSIITNGHMNGNSIGQNIHNIHDGSKIKWAKDVIWSRIKTNKRVTAPNWFQDVRSLELEFDGIPPSYRAGDVLEIKPFNSPEVVQDFLNVIGWNEFADVEYLISATSEDQPLPSHLPASYPTTLRSLLTYELDITSVPRLSFFEFLSYFPSSSEQSVLDLQEKLIYFTKGEGQDDLIDYTLRPRRTILEVLREFKNGLKVPVEYVLDLIPVLRSRGFSIASSSKAHDGEVHLLVAIVGYKTILSIPRKGLCTSYISQLQEGSRIQIKFESGLLKLPPLLPSGLAAPLILIGPGTGVAPFRALMEERIAENSKENLLFFGCRQVEKDFYFKSEWEEMVSKGMLKLIVAASRDQEDKIYVQHRIAEESKLVWDYISRGGYLYICGSSTQMPKSVKKAILVIFEKEGGLIGLDGEKKWESMEKEGRILEETWG